MTPRDHVRGQRRLVWEAVAATVPFLALGQWVFWTSTGWSDALRGLASTALPAAVLFLSFAGDQRRLELKAGDAGLDPEALRLGRPDAERHRR